MSIFEKIKYLFFSHTLMFPNRWDMKKCCDCDKILNKKNFSGWWVFRRIMDKEWSVKICDDCLKEQDKITEKGE